MQSNPKDVHLRNESTGEVSQGEMEEKGKQEGRRTDFEARPRSVPVLSL